MCGITGVFNLNGAQVAPQFLQKMTDRLAHRGPDGQGIFIKENVGLGHRRLSILDLSEKGAQPMHSANKDWTIVFNGCIYNYKELKTNLLSLGHTFVSTTDTEVISEGLAEYGISFFQKLDGMFAVGAYHHSTSTLYLSRDRFGVKPLYYYFQEGVLLFASEIKAFLDHPKFKVKLNAGALNEYFTFQNLFSFRTLFDGVAMLPPANTLAINTSTSEIKHNAWWDYHFASDTASSMTEEEAIFQTEDLFKKAVTKQMVADVPVGSYLSGGMDSGSIAVTAATHVPRLYTFTGGFEMNNVTGVESNFDERRDAELTANIIKSEHYEQVMNSGDLKFSLPKVVYHLEDLRVGMSYPNYTIARLASKFVKVCLQGTGGDELFAGYPWRYYRVFQSLDQKDYLDQYYQYWQRLVSDDQKPFLFQDEVFGLMDITEPRTIFDKVFLFNNKLKYNTPEEHINNSLYFEIKTFLPGLLLVGDKLAMAHGLEERFPFLDNDLVDFVQKMPVKYKLGNLELMKKIDENVVGNKRKLYQQYDDGKNVLRKAMQNILPQEILQRKKQGFSAPDESWYRGENAQYVKELLLGKNIVSHEYIKPKFIEQILHEHTQMGVNHRLLLWSLMNFEWWCRIFINGEKV